MRQIVLTALAESDLMDIWHYTCNQWNAIQADKYLDALDRGIRNLMENPNLGVRRDFVRQGYRVLLIHRHAIYYTVTASAIRIVRVLHGRMDPDSLL